jgi:hypothetical protein
LKAREIYKNDSREIGFGTASASGCPIQLKGLAWPDPIPHFQAEFGIFFYYRK